MKLGKPLQSPKALDFLFHHGCHFFTPWSFQPKALTSYIETLFMDRRRPSVQWSGWQ